MMAKAAMIRVYQSTAIEESDQAHLQRVDLTLFWRLLASTLTPFILSLQGYPRLPLS